jgi:hypothetical protein
MVNTPMNVSTLFAIRLFDFNGAGLSLSLGRIALIQGLSGDVAQIVGIALQAKAG